MPHPCPGYNVVDPFDFSQFNGTWYQFGGPIEDPDEYWCIKDDFGPKDDKGQWVDSKSMTWRRNSTDNRTERINFQMGTRHEAMLTSKTQSDIALPYEIIYTDYANMTIAHTCLEMSYTGIHLAWVLVRDYPKNMTAFHDIYTKAKDILEDKIPGFDYDMKIKHTP